MTTCLSFEVLKYLHGWLHGWTWPLYDPHPIFSGTSAHPVFCPPGFPLTRMQCLTQDKEISELICPWTLLNNRANHAGKWCWRWNPGLFTCNEVWLTLGSLGFAWRVQNRSNIHLISVTFTRVWLACRSVKVRTLLGNCICNCCRRFWVCMVRL